MIRDSELTSITVDPVSLIALSSVHDQPKLSQEDISPYYLLIPNTNYLQQINLKNTFFSGITTSILARSFTKSSFILYIYHKPGSPN